jgi:exonuclease SbcC
MADFMITQVKIKGITSYSPNEWTTIPLTEGKNILVGPNGAGKSTIVEVIKTGLFGTRPKKLTNFDDFIHENESSGFIWITFLLNGHEGEITRKFVRNSANKASIVYGAKGIDINQVGQVNDTIKELLGDVDEQVFINSVFSEQGELDSMIKDEKITKDVIDKVLDLTRFENAEKNMKLIIDEYNDKIEKNKIAVKEIKQETDQLNEREKESRKNDRIIEESQKELLQKEKELVKAEAKFKELDGLKDNIEKTKTIIETKGGFIAKLELEIEKIKQDLGEPIPETEIESKKSEKNKEKKETESAIKRWEDENRKLTSANLILKNLSESSSKMKKAISAKEKTLNDNRNTIEKEFPKITTETNPTKVLKDRQDTLKKELQEVQNQQSEYDQFQQQIVKLNKFVTDHTKNRENLTKEQTKFLIKFHKYFPDDQNVLKTFAPSETEQKRIEDSIHKKHTEALEKLSEIEEKKKNFTKQVNSAETTISKINNLIKKNVEECPTCTQETTRKTLEDIIAINQKIISENSPKIAEMDKIYSNQQTITESLKDEFEQATFLVKSFKDFLLYNDRIQEIKSIEVEITNTENEISQITIKRDKIDIKKIKSIIESLNAKISTIETAKFRLSQLIEAEKEIEQLKEEFGDTEKKIESQLRDITTLQNKEIDKQIASLTQIFNKIDSFISNLEKLNEKILKRNELQNEIKELTIELEKLNKTFSKDEYTKAEELKNDLFTQKGKIKETIDLVKIAQKRLFDEITRLKERNARKNELIRENKQLEIFSERAKQLRTFLDQLPTAILHSKCDSISHDATQILQELYPDSYITALELRSDYKFYTHTTKSEHKINKLSGGEKIGCALALRIALTKNITNLSIMFLDEPTVFLDDERTQKLRELLDNSDLLDQMVIVTHNEEFKKSENASIIEISKNNENYSEINIT